MFSVQLPLFSFHQLPSGDFLPWTMVSECNRWKADVFCNSFPQRDLLVISQRNRWSRGPCWPCWCKSHGPSLVPKNGAAHGGPPVTDITLAAKGRLGRLGLDGISIELTANSNWLGDLTDNWHAWNVKHHCSWLKTWHSEVACANDKVQTHQTPHSGL